MDANFRINSSTCWFIIPINYMPLVLVLYKTINPAQYIEGAYAETLYNWVLLGRCILAAGMDTILIIVTKYCQGPSLSGYNECPCPGIRTKTSSVGSA